MSVFSFITTEVSARHVMYVTFWGMYGGVLDGYYMINECSVKVPSLDFPVFLEW